MTRTKFVAVFLAVLVTGLFAAQAVVAVPGVTAQQETPETGNETQAENETQADNETTATGNETANETLTPSVTFDDQESDGTTVTVSNVTLPDGGYVVVHDELLQDGDALNSVIGVSEYLEPGQYDEVTVTLFDVPGADFGSETTTDEATTANETETTTNETTADETETATNETATETTANETTTETNETGTATETPTETNETGTTTNETTADETETTTNETTNETTADETETATNETTNETEATETTTDGTADEGGQVTLTEDQTLTAMLHVDSNDNQTFDYVTTFSLEDGPYVVAGEPVTDSANVTVADTGNETTETETTTDNGTETATPTESGTGTETPTESGTATETPTETGTETATPTGTETGTPGESSG
ncbi:hypothetical protein EGH21_04895 [Halomicroarcula sp. F13]|uniref:DUF7282 domain-containing protein n=1 Tax=Haloarcula rubra TaxID=2487747 RepID=A0AAW4PNP0_9EURY|nr:hypothetical protein [Halomicroarcula rubra]MBX0322366.1 hypothetical protein [Halomicroarcula rubra]